MDRMDLFTLSPLSEAIPRRLEPGHNPPTVGSRGVLPLLHFQLHWHMNTLNAIWRYWHTCSVLLGWVNEVDLQHLMWDVS